MHPASHRQLLILVVLLGLLACVGPESQFEAGSADARTALIARAASLELDTDYVPPPGQALHHYTSGFAKTLCSAVFITGLDPKDAAANVGGFTSPFEERRHVVDTVVDFRRQQVSLTLPDGVTRTAKKYKNQGCVTHAIGEDSVHFTPTEVARNLPPAASTPWPMGDVLTADPWPDEVDMTKVEEALDVGFGPAEARTLALVVTYKGRILGERYGPEVGIHSPLEGWSMSKSLTGALIGVLIEQGAYELWQLAPIPEWQSPGDSRQAIRIGDIMRMSSGIRIRAPQDPDFDPSIGYPDHLYLYTGSVNSFEWAATRPQEWEPNTVGRYRNSDPVLGNYLIRWQWKGEARTTTRSRRGTCSTRLGSATRSSRPTRTEISWPKGTSSFRPEIGRGWEISISKMVCGTEGGFCLRGTSNTPRRSRQPGSPMGVPNMAEPSCG